MNRARTLIGLFTLATPAWVMAAQLLVLNKGDATLSFFDPATGKSAATIATGVGPHEIEISSDGKLAFVGNYGTDSPGNTLSVIDIKERKELKRVDLGELHRPHGLTFSNGLLYFTAEASRKVGRYNPTTERIDWTFATEQEGTHMVLATRDGAKLFTSNIGSNTVGVLERDSKDAWRQTLISVGAGPEGLDLSPDGREFWSAQSRDGKVSIIDVATKKVIDTIDVKTRRSNRLKFTPNGELVLISDLGAGALVVLDARKRTEKARIELGRAPTGILIPSDEQAYVALSGENKLAVIDLKILTVVNTIATGKSPDGMAWVR
jgi:YVTN family beta-propeller protein